MLIIIAKHFYSLSYLKFKEMDLYSFSGVWHLENPKETIERETGNGFDISRYYGKDLSVPGEGAGRERLSQ